MNNKAKDNKWYIIFAKSPQVKEEWMKAFQRERERVQEDREKGKNISLELNSEIYLHSPGTSIKQHPVQASFYEALFHCQVLHTFS